MHNLALHRALPCPPCLTCSSICRPILHRFANEDVSLGAWLIGLEVEHVDDRSMCCATPPGHLPASSFLILELTQQRSAAGSQIIILL